MKSPIPDYLERVLDNARPDDSGAPAGYIDVLAKADTSKLAVAIAMVDGNVYSAGDDEVEFSIQSISKVGIQQDWSADPFPQMSNISLDSSLRRCQVNRQTSPDGGVILVRDTCLRSTHCFVGFRIRPRHRRCRSRCRAGQNWSRALRRCIQ